MIEEHLKCHTDGYIYLTDTRFCTAGKEYPIIDNNGIMQDCYLIIDDRNTKHYFPKEEDKRSQDYTKWFHLMEQVGEIPLEIKQPYVHPSKYLIDTIKNEDMMWVMCCQLSEVGIYNLKHFLNYYSNEELVDKWHKALKIAKEQQEADAKEKTRLNEYEFSRRP